MRFQDIRVPGKQTVSQVSERKSLISLYVVEVEP